MKLKSFALFSLCAFFSFSAFAAPIPGMNKTKPQMGLYTSEKGFQIDLSESQWIQAPAPKTTQNIDLMFRSPVVQNNMRGTLTVRVDKMSRKIPMKTYIKRWTKQYPKFGFDVLGTKKFALNGQVGYVVDLLNKDKQRRLRQVIFMKDQKAVLLTCRDHMDSFKGTLKECNRMIKGFQWTQV